MSEFAEYSPRLRSRPARDVARALVRVATGECAPRGYYLTGVVVVASWRRRGVGLALTRERIDWIAGRSAVAWYFANIRNRATIDLHRDLGFVEVTRDFWFPGVTFAGGVGALFRLDLDRRS